MAARKNILYLLADQWRYDAVGCNGAGVCKTPHLDALAGEGTRFARAYTTTALCSPARGSILTGLYPHNHGQLSNTNNFNGVFDRNIQHQKGYAQYLREAGYRTGYAGKFHLPCEGDASVWHFDRWHVEAEYTQWLRGQGIEFDFGIHEVQPLEWGGEAPFCGPAAVDAEHHHDAWVADRVIDTLEEFADSGRPFMLCGGFHGPHFPYAVPEPYLSLYRPEKVPRWENFDETFDHKPMVQQKELMRWNTAHLTWPDWQKVIAAYWGYCTFLDVQVGRVLEALKRLGLWEDTAVVFTSDHGDMLGSHRLFNKGFNMYEEDHHIPWILRMPGEEQARCCEKFVSLVDLLPTFLDIAGISAGKDADGCSLLPLARGEEQPVWRRCAYAEFNGYESTLVTMRMLRTPAWKYVYNPFAEDELYDLASDPGELRNLAHLPGFCHVLRRMRAQMLEELEATGDGIVEVTSWQSNSYGLQISPREQ